MTLLLAAQAIVFALWAFLAFRCLFRLLAVTQKSTGQTLPGLRSSLQAPKVFLTDPRFKADRRDLGLVTLLLFILTAILAGNA